LPVGLGQSTGNRVSTWMKLDTPDLIRCSNLRFGKRMPCERSSRLNCFTRHDVASR
jgi:hypothetical protein